MRHSADRLFFLPFLIGIISLAFLTGAIASYYKLPPYTWIEQAFLAYHAMQEKEKSIAAAAHAPSISEHVQKPVLWENGAYDGYTLYVPNHTEAILLDMRGKEVYRWKADFSQVWPHPSYINRPVPDSKVRWRDVLAFPNGDLLAVFEARGDTPYGYGLAKIDKDSRVLWHYDANVHHQIVLDGSGRIYGFVQQVIAPSVPGVSFANPKIIEDSLIVLAPDGSLINRISLIDALANSPYRNVLIEAAKKYTRKADITHANSVVPVSPDAAAAFPMFKPGQVLISMHSLSMIGVLDIPSRKFVWATRGAWRGEHDAEFSPDGIMIFDNLGAGHKRSRIINYNPSTNEIKTIYEGTRDQPFFTGLLGMQQQLPNHNLLITETSPGRIFEITPQGKIVWDFVSPYYEGSKHLPIPSAKRYAAEDLPFLKDIK